MNLALAQLLDYEPFRAAVNRQQRPRSPQSGRRPEFSPPLVCATKQGDDYTLPRAFALLGFEVCHQKWTPTLSQKQPRRSVSIS